MAIRAVIFDIGSVLENNPRLGIDQKWETLLGLKPGEINARLGETWAAGSIGSITLEEVHRRIRESLNISDAQVDALMNDMWTEYVGTLNQDLYDYFKALRTRYRTGILSNSFVGAREREQTLYGFEDTTEHIIYSHEVGFSKPDPRIYQLTCERFGVQPAEMLFVDDVPQNIDAARAFGIHAVLYRETTQAIGEIEAILSQVG